jgi:hypothetical protein
MIDNNIDIREKNLFDHLNYLNIPAAAQEWLLMLFRATQGLDDWYDGDKVEKRDIENYVYLLLVQFPSNPFYMYYQKELTPILSNYVLKWTGANALEAKGEQLHKSFMWRAGFYDVVLEVVRIVHGPQVAIAASEYVVKMYGENLEDHIKEFTHG